MAKDLRTYLKILEQESPSQLAYVDKEVDPKYEIASIVRKLQDEPNGAYPAVFCTNVKGFPHWRVLTNLCGTDYRMALGIDATPEQAIKEYTKRVTNPIPPIEVSTGPVKDIIKIGDEVDINDIPLLSHTTEEPAPFMDGEVLVLYDEENSRYNTGIYRMMKKAPRKTGIFFAQGTHAYSILCQAEARDEPLEFAAVVGHHPAFIYGCQVQTVEDEYNAIGGVMGEPLELVDCETVDLKVPANAELIVEGVIQPHVREKEGPFCEFTYLLGKERESPVCEITAITHRKDPIYFDVYNPGVEHVNIGKLPMEVDIYRKAKDSVSQVMDVFMPAEASRTVAMIQVRNEYPGIGKQAAIAAASAKYFPKIIIVVDEEQNIRDPYDVWWAMAMKCRPDRDFNFIKDAYVENLIPVATTGRGWPDTHGGVDTKLFIDATKPLDVDYPPYCEPPKEIWENMNLGEYIRGRPSETT